MEDILGAEIFFFLKGEGRRQTGGGESFSSGDIFFFFTRERVTGGYREG